MSSHFSVFSKLWDQKYYFDAVEVGVGNEEALKKSPTYQVGLKIQKKPQTHFKHESMNDKHVCKHYLNCLGLLWWLRQ